MVKLIVEQDSVREENGLWKMVVRCSTALKKGDQLFKAIPYTVKFEKDRVSCDEIANGAIPVSLKVDRIISYRRETDRISTGTTAVIFVSGNASAVRKQSYLVSHPC